MQLGKPVLRSTYFNGPIEESVGRQVWCLTWDKIRDSLWMNPRNPVSLQVAGQVREQLKKRDLR